MREPAAKERVEPSPNAKPAAPALANTRCRRPALRYDPQHAPTPRAMTETADVIVIGLGAVGSAALHRLALRGVRAIGIDRFHPPHDQGSTHGHTRLTRLAVAEGAVYLPLVRRSHEIWRELEAQTGETLLQQIGMLLIAEGDGAPSHGKAAFLGSTLAIAQAHGIAHELLGSAEIRRRYPQFQVRDAERGYFEPSAGVLFPERCVAAQLALAAALGAQIRTGETALRIEPTSAGVAILTSHGRYEAARVILAAGAWLPELAGGPLPSLAAVQRQTVLWLQTNEPHLYHPARCPVFIWQHGASELDYLYGFPLLPGAAGIKAGTERYDGHIPPDAVDRRVTPDESAAIYRRHIAGRLRGVTGEVLNAAACLYTVTPDAGFILDRMQDGRVIVASACSGHGFKHSPAVGEHVAALALNAAQPAEPEFALARFPPARLPTPAPASPNAAAHTKDRSQSPAPATPPAAAA